MNNFQSALKYTMILLLFGTSLSLQAQSDPTDSLPGDPGALSVYNVQDMHFGAFTHGDSGGSISLSTSGMRSVTGSVLDVDLGIAYFQAIFDIAAPEGAMVSIMNGSDATLTGSNGGSMSLHLGSASPASPFTITIPSPGHTPVSIGGTLTVGNATANPPGTYSGTFYLTFNLE